MFSLLSNWLEPLAYFIFFTSTLFLYNGKEIIPKALLYFSLISTLLMVASSCIVQFQLVENNLICYYFLEMITNIFLIILINQIIKFKTIKQFLLIICIANAAYSIYLCISFNKTSLYNSIGNAILCFTVTIFSFAYFIDKFKNIDEKKIYHTIQFWIVIRFFFYYVTNVFIFVYYFYLSKKVFPNGSFEDAVLLTQLWGLHNIFLFISSLIFTFILCILYRKKLHY